MIDNLDGHREALVLMTLREPKTYDVDLSSVDVGEAFTLQSSIDATTYNRIARGPSEFGTSASAFLRDPLGGTGGSSVTFDGLEPTDVPDLPRPAEEPVEPAPCQSIPVPRQVGESVPPFVDPWPAQMARPTAGARKRGRPCRPALSREPATT